MNPKKGNIKKSYQGGFILLPCFKRILHFLLLEPDYGIMKLYISIENLKSVAGEMEEFLKIT